MSRRAPPLEDHCPALVMDSQGTILASNRAAVELIGWDAGRLRGRSCHEVICGTDVFGNAFCSDRCSLMAMAARREKPRYFEMDVTIASGQTQRVGFVTLAGYGVGGADFTLTHLFRPVAPASDERASALRNVPLSRRQLEVLRRLAELKESCAIAAELGISAATVRRDVQALLCKLGARGKLEAVFLAGQKRIL